MTTVLAWVAIGMSALSLVWTTIATQAYKNACWVARIDPDLSPLYGDRRRIGVTLRNVGGHAARHVRVRFAFDSTHLDTEDFKTRLVVPGDEVTVGTTYRFQWHGSLPTPDWERDITRSDVRKLVKVTWKTPIGLPWWQVVDLPAAPALRAPMSEDNKTDPASTAG